MMNLLFAWEHTAQLPIKWNSMEHGLINYLKRYDYYWVFCSYFVLIDVVNIEFRIKQIIDKKYHETQPFYSAITVESTRQILAVIFNDHFCLYRNRSHFTWFKLNYRKFRNKTNVMHIHTNSNVTVVWLCFSDVVVCSKWEKFY